MQTSRHGERGWLELDALLFVAILAVAAGAVGGSARAALDAAARADRVVLGAIDAGNETVRQVVAASE